MEDSRYLARSTSRRRAASVIRNASLTQRAYVVGILFLLVVVVLWTASNFITQNLFRGGFERPFLVTYLNTSAFSLYLVPFCIRYLMNGWHPSNPLLPRGRQSQRYQPISTDDALERAVDEPHKIILDTHLRPLTMRETRRLALEFCFFWFIANWSVNASLDFTSVASATILTSMSGFFTLGIGRVFGVESFDLAKIAAVVASFIGVAVVSLSDGKQDGEAIPSPAEEGSHARSPLYGDVLALASALCYAIYVILLKVRIKSESRVDMQLFFGFVGLFNMLLCWPMVIVLHVTGIEKFGLPSNTRQLGGLLVNMAITLSSDYIYVLAMLKTTPLVVTVGLSLTIPLAVAGDFFIGKPASGQVLFGAVLVLLSFIGVGVSGSKEDKGEESVILPGEDTVSEGSIVVMQDDL